MSKALGFDSSWKFGAVHSTVEAHFLGDRFLSSAGTRKNAHSLRLSDPSPVLGKNRAPMGPEILSSTGLEEGS